MKILGRPRCSCYLCRISRTIDNPIDAANRIEALEAALRELADALEAHIEAHRTPHEVIKYLRDSEPIVKARALLSDSEAPKKDQVE